MIRPDRRRLRSRALAISLSSALILSGGAALSANAAKAPDDTAQHSLRSPVTKENFYFVMADRFANGDTGNDTGGLVGGPMETGFDPTAKGFFQGGDLKGLQQQLDYIEDLGTTAIWLTPSFKNKAVQPADKSAGYHGYWVTDFTQIDPHLGSNDDLKTLIDAAHDRGMKVYFDIITNHTADVIGYRQPDGSYAQRLPYASKDAAPYKDASGQVFDDRDYAGTQNFPALDATTSFPYTPEVPAAEQDIKVPAWLNDPTLYHNRGDTTFAGENSQYGDFFGLDDLFTENPKVVDGFVDVYQTWIGDFGVDGFRIDTMKHVNDEFWQQFGPKVLQYAHSQGKDEFFMFGEVFDTSRPATSRYSTHAKMQAVLDFPFQDAARKYASASGSAADLSTFFKADDWYTDADSNVYQMPTFLGNHDMGRIGHFLQQDNPGASAATLLAKDRLAHELMYFSRGNPVIYYGDEQGFTGTGGDQLARQTMFASKVPEYLADPLIGTAATHAQDNFNTGHPLYTDIAKLSTLIKANPALRDGTMQVRHAANGPGVFAFSRTDVNQRREYVVAINNTTTARAADIPTYLDNRAYRLIYGSGTAKLNSSKNATLPVKVPPLSTVVYAMDGKLPAAGQAPTVRINQPSISAQDNSRMQVRASVDSNRLVEVTFQAKASDGVWRNIGTDDNAPYGVFHDVAGYPAGTELKYRAIVLDSGKTTTSSVLKTAVPVGKVSVSSPTAGSKVRGAVTVQATVDPEKASNVVALQRQVGNGDWTTLGTDSSSPVYTAVDQVDGLGQPGTTLRYRAALLDGERAVATSAAVEVTIAPAPVTMATVNYHRPGGDYDGWGLHLWGDGIDPAALAGIAWDKPMPPTRIVDGWAQFDIPLTSDTAPVNFIVHTAGGDTVPTTREPGGDRSFTPTDGAAIWLKQGDPKVYSTRP